MLATRWTLETLHSLLAHFAHSLGKNATCDLLAWLVIVCLVLPARSPPSAEERAELLRVHVVQVATTSLACTQKGYWT